MSTTPPAPAGSSNANAEALELAQHNGKRINTLILDHDQLMASAKLIGIVAEIENVKASIEGRVSRNSPTEDLQHQVAHLKREIIRLVKASPLSPNMARLWKDIDFHHLPSKFTSESTLGMDLKTVASTVAEFIGNAKYGTVAVDPETFFAYVNLLALVQKYTKVQFGEALLALLPVREEKADSNDD